MGEVVTETILPGSTEASSTSYWPGSRASKTNQEDEHNRAAAVGRRALVETPAKQKVPGDTLISSCKSPFNGVLDRTGKEPPPFHHLRDRVPGVGFS